MSNFMTVGDVPFVSGPFFGPFISAAILAVVFASKRPTRFVVAAAVLTGMVWASAAVYWLAWGPMFEAADAGTPPPHAAELGDFWGLISAATGVGLLLVLCVLMTVLYLVSRRDAGIVARTAPWACTHSRLGSLRF